MNILLRNGKWALANGRPVLMSAGAAAPAPAPSPPGNSGTLSLTLTDFFTAKTGVQPVVQRKAGTEYADVPVLFSFTGTQPTNVQARVIKSSGGAVVVDWTTLTSVTVDGSLMLGTLPGVPLGADYLLQIRDGLNTATVSNGAVPWGVGVIFMFEGQSNMVGTLGGSYTEIVPGTSQSEYAYALAGSLNGKAAIWDTAGWHAPSNGSSNGPSGINTATGNVIKFLRIVAASLKTKYGKDVPIGIIPWAFGSQSIESFTKPAGANYTSLFGKTGTTSGAIGFGSPRNVYAGDFEGAFWHQGEANNGDSSATYLTKLTAYRQQLLDYVAQFSRSASQFFFGAAVLGNYASLYYIENIRNAVLNSGWAAWTTIDLPRGTGDSLHFTDPAVQKRSMMRCIQSALKWLGCATFSGKGPQITSTTVARSGNTAVLAVAHEGGTALAAANSGSAITGFYANTAADFSGTEVAVVATITGPSQITLTFDAGQTYPVYVKYLGGRVGSTVASSDGYVPCTNPNIGNLIYDNTVYPTGATGTDVEALGLPLLPSNGAITVTGS